MIAMTMNVKGEKMRGIVINIPCSVLLWFAFMGGVGGVIQ